jgi:hypothetical protein
VGNYTSNENVGLKKLSINPNYTFVYSEFDIFKFLVKEYDIDSCHFISRGKWTLINNHIVLNSFDNSFTDTARVRNVLKTATSSKESNFSFKDIYGNTIEFNGIDDEKGNFAFIFDKQYSNYDVDLTRHNVLTFYTSIGKLCTFIKKDNAPANYVITIAPYYKQGYFENKVFKVKRNRIKDDKVKFKRDKSNKNDPSI